MANAFQTIWKDRIVKVSKVYIHIGVVSSFIHENVCYAMHLKNILWHRFRNERMRWRMMVGIFSRKSCKRFSLIKKFVDGQQNDIQTLIHHLKKTKLLKWQLFCSHFIIWEMKFNSRRSFESKKRSNEHQIKNCLSFFPLCRSFYILNINWTHPTHFTHTQKNIHVGQKLFATFLRITN